MMGETPSYICSLFLETNILKETFEDTKGVIKIRKSENDRQYNDQKKQKKTKGQTAIYKT